MTDHQFIALCLIIIVCTTVVCLCLFAAAHYVIANVLGSDECEEVYSTENNPPPTAERPYTMEQLHVQAQQHMQQQDAMTPEQLIGLTARMTALNLKDLAQLKKRCE